MKRFAFGLLLAAVLASGAGAERLPFRRYSTEDGLAGDSIRDLHLDARGFLWIGTSAGLSRFDGFQFRNYDSRDGLPGPRINVISEMRDGTLWVGTDDGLARLDPRPPVGAPAFVAELIRPAGKEVGVTGLLEDRGGRLWVCLGHELWVRDRAGEPARQVALPRGVLVEGSIVEAPDGSLWMLAGSGILRLLPDGSFRSYPFRSPDDSARDLAFDAQGVLWIARADGLLLFRPEGSERAEGRALPLLDGAARPLEFGPPKLEGTAHWFPRLPGLDDPFVYSVMFDREGVAWVATRSGLLRWDGHQPRSIRMEQGLPDKPVTTVETDAAGTLWVGTETRGLARLNRTSLVTYGEADGLLGDRVSSLFEVDEDMYAVTWSRRLLRFEQGRFVEITPHWLLSNTFTGWGWNQFNLRDRHGSWWFPTGSGLYRFGPVARPEDLRHARPVASYRLGAGLPGNDVFRLFEDRAGRLWVSTISTPTLSVLESGHPPRVVPESAGALNGGAPTAFAEDGDGSLWMGFYSGGVARVHEGRWRFFGVEDGVPPGFVADLRLDSAGRLWIATFSGLGRVDRPTADDPKFVRVRDPDGLTSEAQRCVVEGDDGLIYLGTARGVDRFDPKTGTYSDFPGEDGLPNQIVWTCYRARDGSLWFGTPHGLSRFEPGAESPGPASAALISGLRLRGVRQPVSDLGVLHLSDFELDAAGAGLEIEYLAIAPNQGNSVVFQYRLKGSDSEWSRPTRTRNVILPGVAPGRYRFEVRAVNRDGVVSREPASVDFTVLQPIWRRPWFLAAISLIIALTVWSVQQARLRRLVAVERERTRIASDLHDDVGASLSRIGLLGDLAQQRIRTEPGEAEAMLGTIGAEARHLVETTSDMVWAVDPAKDDLGSLLVRLRRFAGDLLEAQGIDLGFEVPAQPTAIGLSPAARRGTYLLLKEAIHNVARHSRARSARIRLTIVGGVLEGEVLDDGVGLPRQLGEADGHHGHGLSGMQRRVSRLGGQLSIATRSEGGVRVLFRIPLA